MLSPAHLSPAVTSSAISQTVEISKTMLLFQPRPVYYSYVVARPPRHPPPPPSPYIHRAHYTEPLPRRPPPAPTGAPVHVRVGAAFSPEWTRRTLATAKRASSTPVFTAPYQARVNRAAIHADRANPSEWDRDDFRVDNFTCHDFGHRYRSPVEVQQMRWPRCIRGEMRLRL